MRSENSHAKKKSLFEYWQLESTPNRNLIEELTFKKFLKTRISSLTQEKGRVVFPP